ncbi:MAG: polysaccharide biosynthesis C-terminal domain-containing protein [Candidatus Thermoplasmatota archaeon]|nr:polysaccharide biosynthesis C-terminal domain-containing protein [Candidatus Thermoplasmatota archaeon]
MTEATKEPSAIGSISFQYAGSTVQFLFGALFYIILLHFFTTSMIGEIALLLAFVSLFNIVFSLGLNKGSQHFISVSLGGRVQDVPSFHAYRFMILCTTLALASIVVFVLLVPSVFSIFFHTHISQMTIYIVGFVAAGNVLFTSFRGIILGFRWFKTFGIISVIVWSFYYTLSLLLGIEFRSVEFTSLGWFIGIMFGVLIELTIIFRGTRLKNGEKEFLKARTILSYSFPIMIASIINFGAAYIDRLIVAGVLNLSLLGIYNIALLISSSVTLLSTPINYVIFSIFSENFGMRDFVSLRSNFRTSTLILSVFYVPFAVLLASLSRPVILLLAGPAYLPSAFPLIIILFSYGLFCSANITTQIIGAIERTRVFFVSTGASLLSNLLLSIILIPRYGITGASIGYSSVVAVDLLFQYIIMKKTGLIKYDLKGLFKIWGSSLMMFVFVFYLSEFLEVNPHLLLAMLPVNIIIGLVIYTLLIRYLKPLSNDDCYLLRREIPKLKWAFRILFGTR